MKSFPSYAKRLYELNVYTDGRSIEHIKKTELFISISKHFRKSKPNNTATNETKAPIKERCTKEVSQAIRF
jgi:hypothetical protein